MKPFSIAAINILLIAIMPIWVIPWLILTVRKEGFTALFTKGSLEERIRTWTILLLLPLFCWLLFLLGNEVEDFYDWVTGKKWLF